jgi:hypothetical protein
MIEAEEDARREQQLKEHEDRLKKIQEVIDRKKKERLDTVDHMYKKGLERLAKEQKEDNTDAIC